LKFINITAEVKREMLMANLERKRWIKPLGDAPHVRVNIASFKMQFIDKNEEVYFSNVVVGKQQKKTPVFTDTLELVVLNPTWTLPHSITSTETLSKLKKDPNYLQKHQMVLMTRGGEIIDPNGIDWSQYSQHNFPYMVRQEPGPHNSLGRVKFLFPNKYSIYMHDTPSKYLFAKEKRAFSHGCMRLQNPLDFALFILKKDDANWSKEKIDDIIASEKTDVIRLKNYYPVQILYQTTGLNSNGEIYFYNDIYSRDNILFKKLSTQESIKDVEKQRIEN